MTSPSPNRSTAVMAQRIEADDSLDDFPTPPFAARALMEHVLIPAGVDPARLRIWEPACNRGHMAAPLEEYASFVLATDIADYSNAVDVSPHWRARDRWADGLLDFTDPMAPDAASFERALASPGDPDRWVITNPPFNLAEAFQWRAADLGVNCAFLLRTPFLEGQGRYARLFSPEADPPALIAPFAERVVMLKGRLVRCGDVDPAALAAARAAALKAGEDPARVDPLKYKASTATAYTWLIWNRAWREAQGGTRVVWIPPCQDALEREGDYPVYPEGHFDEPGVRAAMAEGQQGALF